MLLTLALESLGTGGCYGGAVLVLLLIVGAVGRSKKSGNKKSRIRKRSKLDEYAESGDRNQQIINEAYRQFDSLTANQIKALSKQLGKNSIGEPPTLDRETLKHLVSAKRLDTATTIRQIISIFSDLELDEGFMHALEVKHAVRIEAMLSKKWSKLQTRAEKKVTDKVFEAWDKFATELDDLCQGSLWSQYGPIPELLWSWSERVQSRANEVEEQIPE